MAENEKTKRDKGLRCPCGDVIIADTEDWATPLCYNCYPKALVAEIEKLNKYSDSCTLETANLMVKLKTKDAVIEKLREGLEHPDFEGISCECGYFGDDTEETGMSICVKCNAEQVLKETKQMMEEG